MRCACTVNRLTSQVNAQSLVDLGFGVLHHRAGVVQRGVRATCGWGGRRVGWGQDVVADASCRCWLASTACDSHACTPSPLPRPPQRMHHTGSRPPLEHSQSVWWMTRMMLQPSTSWHTISDLQGGLFGEVSSSDGGGRQAGRSAVTVVLRPHASLSGGKGHLITSSVTRPPPLRITSASPCFRPCVGRGSGKEHWQSRAALVLPCRRAFLPAGHSVSAGRCRDAQARHVGASGQWPAAKAGCLPACQCLLGPSI